MSEFLRAYFKDIENPKKLNFKARYPKKLLPLIKKANFVASRQSGNMSGILQDSIYSIESSFIYEEYVMGYSYNKFNFIALIDDSKKNHILNKWINLAKKIHITYDSDVLNSGYRNYANNNNYIVNNGKGPFDDSYDLEIFHLYENIINNNR